MKKSFQKWHGDISDLFPGDRPRNVIFDTDAGPDVDDTAALVMLYHYARLGKVNILATVSDSSSPYGAPYLSALNKYYGFPDVPVGAMKTSKSIVPLCDGKTFNIELTSRYDTDVTDGINARDAVRLYREVLANAPDKSVIIIVTGMQTNIADLLRSEPDDLSALCGVELVEKKVCFISDMGGEWPEGNIEFNIEMDVSAAQTVAERCPVPVVYSGFTVGDKIMTGPNPDALEIDSPLRLAWWERPSWDQTAVILAVEGVKDFWTLRRGDVYFDDDGRNHFVENDTDGARFFIVPNEEKNSVIADYISDMANSVKKNSTDKYKIKSILAENTALSDGWTRITADSDVRISYTLGKALMRSCRDGAEMSVSFFGKVAHIYGARTLGGGGFEVLADGERVSLVDTASDTEPTYLSEHLFSVIFDNNAEHTVSLRATGQAPVYIDFIKMVSDI